MKCSRVFGTLSLMALSALPFFACRKAKETAAETGTERQRTQDDDRLFQRKLECGKLLARVEDSTLGPSSHHDKGVVPMGPVVFYSSSLNTCVHIRAYLLTGKTVTQPPRSFMTEYVSVEDLLSGQLLENREFDVNVAAEAKAARDYQAEVIKRFGGAVPSTGLPPGWEEPPKPQK